MQLSTPAMRSAFRPPKLRALAKRIGPDQRLAEELWQTGILEARAISSLMGEPAPVSQALMEDGVKDFDSWAVCDACCCNLFDKTGADSKFLRFLHAIRRGARNFAKKAVNWALPQIGKRNPNLHREAIRPAREIVRMKSRTARWLAADALRALQSGAVQRRLKSH